MVRDAIDPLTQGGLNETLGFTIGLLPIGTREAMLQSETAAGGREVLGAKGRAVVAERAPDDYPKQSRQDTLARTREMPESSHSSGLTRRGKSVSDAKVSR